MSDQVHLLVYDLVKMEQVGCYTLNHGVMNKVGRSVKAQGLKIVMPSYMELQLLLKVF